MTTVKPSIQSLIRPSPADKNEELTMLLYGEPGEGKTPLISTITEVPQWCPALLIDVDNGALSARKAVTLETIHLTQAAQTLNVSPWVALEQLRVWLSKGDHPYKTVMLDGGTDLEQYCDEDTLDYARNNPGQSRSTQHDAEMLELQDVGRVQSRLWRCYIHFRDLRTAKGSKVNFIATAHVSRKQAGTDLTFQPMFRGKTYVKVTSVFDVVAMLMHDEKGKQVLIPSLDGRVRGRDRTEALSKRMENPSMPKIYEALTRKA